MRRTGIGMLLLTTVLLISGAASAYELRAFEGKSAKATMEQIGPQIEDPNMKGSAYYTEMYSFDLQGKGSADFWFQIVLTNIGMTKGTAVVRSEYKPQTGAKTSHAAKFERNQWNYKADKKSFSIDLGTNTLSGDGSKWTINVNNDLYSAKIEVKTELAPWRPGGGRVYYGKSDQKYYDYTLLVPRGEFTGEVTIKATKEKVQIKGQQVFADHSVWNIEPKVQAKRWFKMREVEQGYTVVASVFQTTEEYGSKWVGFVISATDKSIENTVLNPTVLLSDLKTDSEPGYEYPMKVIIKAPDLLFEFTGKKMDKRTDRVEELSKTEGVLVQILGGIKPIEFKVRCDWKFESGKINRSGSSARYSFEQFMK